MDDAAWYRTSDGSDARGIVDDHKKRGIPLRELALLSQCGGRHGGPSGMVLDIVRKQQTLERPRHEKSRLTLSGSRLQRRFRGRAAREPARAS
jgi:hypothetical protein